jgi:hypothetical protein
MSYKGLNEYSESEISKIKEQMLQDNLVLLQQNQQQAQKLTSLVDKLEIKPDIVNVINTKDTKSFNQSD